MANPFISINSTPGKFENDHDGNNLLDCYFQEDEVEPGRFNLYRSTGALITTRVQNVASPVSSGEEFTFEFNNLSWTITNFVISKDTLTASGDWEAQGLFQNQTGTFQAKVRLTIIKGDGLMGCYFVEIADTGTFKLHQPNNARMITAPENLSSGQDFGFDKYSGSNWQITAFSISETTLMGEGTWSIKREGDGEGDPESGTFQAQAGGTPLATAKRTASAAR